MGPRQLLSVALSVLAASTLIAAETRAEDLTGLWKAKRLYGPYTHGTLTILKSGDAYRADLSGYSIPVSVEKGELVFTTPNRDATFRGRVGKDGAIIGEWFRAETPVNSGEYAYHVTLRPGAAGRWSGRVDPPQDEFTFYLLLAKNGDGSYRALLRNPERDVGTQWGANRLAVDGKNLKLIGRRGGNETQIAAGMHDAETAALILDFPQRGGAYTFVRDNDASEFYPRGKNPGRYSYRAPLALDDGWPVATLDEARIERAAIEKLVQRILDASMDSADAPQVHALLLARHGKLVLEEYFHGSDRESLHNLRSASKSITTVIAGAAMNAGVSLRPTTKVHELLKGPADDPQKRDITLENLLTMSPGYFCDDTNDNAPGNEETMQEQSTEPDYYQYIMRVPMVTRPGENAVYCSAVANLALGAVGAAAGESPMYTFGRLVAAPMGIEHYGWAVDPLHRPYGGGGMALTARDFAKFGQLLLNGGVWRGQRILSADFAKRAVSKLYHLRNIYYGYFFWGEDYPYKERTVYAYSMRGSGGQTVTVIPELELVVTTMAGSFFSRKGQFAASTDAIPNTILPATREKGDALHAPVVEIDYRTPYGASKDGRKVQ